MWIKIKNLILDLLFPRVCINCQKEGEYLCQDCQAMLEISGFHKKYSTQNLDDLYFVADFKNSLIKNLINLFKKEPFVKELGKTLSSLILAHFQLMDNKPEFYPDQKRETRSTRFAIIPVPLAKKKLKWRGFNQAEKLAENLAVFLKISLLPNGLVKIKETFSLGNKTLVKEKNILLVDDVYQTGSTMEKCAEILKKAGAKKIIGIVVVRG